MQSRGCSAAALCLSYLLKRFIARWWNTLLTNIKQICCIVTPISVIYLGFIQKRTNPFIKSIVENCLKERRIAFRIVALSSVVADSEPSNSVVVDSVNEKFHRYEIYIIFVSILFRNQKGSTLERHYRLLRKFPARHWDSNTQILTWVINLPAIQWNTHYIESQSKELTDNRSGDRMYSY